MSREFKVSLSHNVGKSADNQSSHRWAFAGVLLDGACAVATDGRQLVAVPYTAEYCDTGEELSGPELISAKAAQGKTRSRDLSIVVNGRCESKGKIFDRPEGSFPNWRDVLPTFDGDTEKEIEVAVTLKPEYLRRMLDGMTDHDDTVTFLLKVERSTGFVNSPIGAFSESNGIGVLMPAATELKNVSTLAEKFNSRVRTYRDSSKHTRGTIYNAPENEAPKDSAAA